MERGGGDFFSMLLIKEIFGRINFMKKSGVYLML